ncbi:hypothetical protein CPB84DRAFT_1773769 [Gymnopilus junonius]|uniref:F-box domain-containing protein n=1 Tax=Gymnopilus junonius TaxID=109634 RepID=A0A9P5NRI4_GYMJU|nr:hypothetical protein CPB84DRAFT_1773769 [Gymnopilus junonius]
MTGCDFCDFSRPGRYKLHRSCEMYNGGPCDVCTNLEDLDSKILASKAALELLVEQHRRLRTQANKKHDRITRLLPAEIISSIFTFCMPEIPPAEDGALRTIGKDKLATRFVLSAVCRDWRSIALSTPQLWCLIVISLETSNLAEHFSASRELIARSGRLPLSIDIFSDVLSEKPDPEDMDGFYSLIQLINEQASRWHILELEIPTPFFSRFSGVCGPIHRLRRFRLHPISVDSKTFKFGMCDGKLEPEELRVQNVRLKAVDISWNWVTYAHLTQFRIDECFEFLRRTPRLEECFFEAIWGRNEKNLEFPIGPNVLHSQLQCLSVSSPQINLLFDNITVPALQILDCRKLYEIPADAILSLLGRSGCILEKLLLTAAYDFEATDLIALLEKIPSIQGLQLYTKGLRASSPDTLFEHLASTSVWKQGCSGNNFLPELKNLCYVHFESREPFSWSLIPDIFGPISCSGESHRRPLESIDLQIDYSPKHGHIDKVPLSRILTVLDAGMCISITASGSGKEIDYIDVSAKYHGIERKRPM